MTITLHQCQMELDSCVPTGVMVTVSDTWVREHFNPNAAGRIIFDQTASIPVDVWNNLSLPNLKLDLLIQPPLDFKETIFK